jgi:hypothetical protein
MAKGSVGGLKPTTQNLHGSLRSVGSVIYDSTQVGLLDGLLTRKKYLSRKVSSIIPGSSMLRQIQMRDTVPLKGFPYTLGSAV